MENPIKKDILKKMLKRSQKKVKGVIFNTDPIYSQKPKSNNKFETQTKIKIGHCLFFLYSWNSQQWYIFNRFLTSDNNIKWYPVGVHLYCEY